MTPCREAEKDVQVGCKVIVTRLLQTKKEMRQWAVSNSSEAITEYELGTMERLVVFLLVSKRWVGPQHKISSPVGVVV